MAKVWEWRVKSVTFTILKSSWNLTFNSLIAHVSTSTFKILTAMISLQWGLCLLKLWA
jgi:hypothetical protein